MTRAIKYHKGTCDLYHKGTCDLYHKGTCDLYHKGTCDLYTHIKWIRGSLYHGIISCDVLWWILLDDYLMNY